jgi:hypothetical protein
MLTDLHAFAEHTEAHPFGYSNSPILLLVPLGRKLTSAELPRPSGIRASLFHAFERVSPIHIAKAEWYSGEPDPRI